MATGNFSHSWIKDGSDHAAVSRRTRHRRRKGIFEDILEERRQRGDLGWVLRSRSVPQFQFGLEPNSKSPAEIKREVLASDRLRYGLAELAADTGASVSELAAEAAEVLDEMAHNLSLFSVRSFGFAVIKVMKRLYRAVYVNTEGLLRLRGAMSQYPVILLPMHRSYADFLLLSLLCFDYDLPLPVIAAAMDFKGMHFIGTLLRNCGAFFIRRSFATDRVYWLTFVEFVKTHVRDGLDPVEFFIEGTRSRTNKSLFPKTGMLGAILESWFMCEVPDIYLVPVSISYDRVLEEKPYAFELLGVPKPKETTAGLLRARSMLSEDFGNVHFVFDEPISLRKFAEAHGVDRSVHSLQPKVKAGLTEGEKRMLKSLSHYAVWRQNLNCVVPAFSLVATVLLAAAAGTSGAAVPTVAVVAGVQWLRRWLLHCGASVDWPNESSSPAAGSDSSATAAVISNQLQLHSDLAQFAGDGDKFVKLLTDDDGVEAAAAAASAAAAAAADGGESALMLRAARHLRLASYRNQLIFHTAAAGLLACLRQQQEQQQQQQQQQQFATLQQLFHREFALDAKTAEQNFAEADSRLADADSKTGSLLRSTVLPFLLAYACVLRFLLANAAEVQRPLMERQLAAAVQRGVVSDALLRRGAQPACYEALSLDLLTNAIHGLHRLRLIVKSKDPGGPNFFDWRGLKELRLLLDSIVSSVQQQQQQQQQQQHPKL